MMNDTTKDPRILAAKLACAVLKSCVTQKAKLSLKANKEQLAKLAAACESATLALQYAYLPADALVASEFMESLAAAVDALAKAYEPLLGKAGDGQPLLQAKIRWCLRTLGGLRGRLSNPGRTLASGVDLVVVRVRALVPAGDLRKTRVSDGHADYTVMTNLRDVEVNGVLAAAFLPPREVGGAVSEAMFLGSQPRSEPPGTLLTEDQADAREAASILYDELAKVH